ncbi:MAG: hypothetical protein WC457_01290 [Patescibacteria group bacterium]
MFKRALLIGEMFLLLSSAAPVHAYDVQQIPETPVFNDFVVGPGKTEIKLDAGQTVTKTMVVTNRYGVDMRFNFKVEDFTGSSKSNEVIRLLGDEKGPYSLKDFIKPETDSLILKHGERARVQVTISIPKDATPAGLYGAVIVTTEPVNPAITGDESGVQSGITVESRIASLYFVRINGDVFEEGSLTSFASDAKYYKNGTIKLTYDYKNTGSIYLAPYGVLEITNLYGTKVDELSIRPYFVMPGSTRSEWVTLSRDLMIGRYKATIKLNRGYGDTVDVQSVVFWVLPWKIIAGFFGGLAILIILWNLIVRWFKNNFEYKGGKKKNAPPTAPMK